MCGNGFRETGEGCDDSNTTSGDGCSATCEVEAATAETEPNGTLAEANWSGLVGAGIRTVTGAIQPSGDSDDFTFEVPAGAQRLTLRARTYSAVGNPLSACNDSVDTRLRLYDSNGSQLEDNDDISGSSNRCSIIAGNGGAPTLGGFSTPDTDPNARNLAPGTYTLRVSYFSDSIPGTTGTYFLEIQLIQE